MPVITRSRSSINHQVPLNPWDPEPSSESMTSSFSPVTQVNPGDLVLVPSVPISVGEYGKEQLSRAYKDLLIFEERLKGNMNRLRKRRQRYEAFLGFLSLIILYFTYAVLINPSQDSTRHTINQTFLFITITVLILFFVTGLYKEKVVAASKFIPQCNRVLRQFNMTFIFNPSPTPSPVPPGPHLTFFRRIPRRFQDGFAAYRASYHARRRGGTPPAPNVRRRRESSESRGASPAPSSSTGSTSGRRMKRGRGSVVNSTGS